MNRKEKADVIKKIAKQVIYYRDPETREKIAHFLFGRGKVESYKGVLRDKKAILTIKSDLWITFGVELNTNFLNKWQRLAAIYCFPLFTRYENISILVGSQPDYLIYCGDIKTIPPEPLDLEKIRRVYDNLYQLAQHIENNERSSALSKIPVTSAIKFEKLNW